MVFLFVALSLAVLGGALPVDPRREKKTPNIPNVDDLRQGNAPRHRMPDTPGLDVDEYQRYWKEMAKDNPGRPTFRVLRKIVVGVGVVTGSDGM